MAGRDVCSRGIGVADIAVVQYFCTAVALFVLQVSQGVRERAKLEHQQRENEQEARVKAARRDESRESQRGEETARPHVCGRIDASNIAA